MIPDETLRRWLPPAPVALLGDVIRGLLWAAVIVTWAYFAQVYLRLWRLTVAAPGHSDFTIFYYTARLVADGFPMYGTSPVRYGVDWTGAHLGNLNPPHFQLLLQPLALLSYANAFAVWSTVNAAALLGSLLVIVRALAIPLTWRRVLVGGAVLMAAAPFTSVAVTSEWTFLLMVPFSLSWRAAREGRWRAAGAWLGLCLALKLFFLLFVPWLLVRRRWAALASAACAAVACALVGMLVYGPGSYLLWAQALRTVGWWGLPLNASWHGLVSRLLEGSETLAPIVRAPSLVPPLALGGAACIAALSVCAGLRLENEDDRLLDATVLILLAGAILASPLGWVYYVPLALAPVTALIWTGRWRAVPIGWRPVAITGTLCLYLQLEDTLAGQPSPFATLTIASSYFWGVAACWAALVATAFTAARARWSREAPS